MTGLAPGRVAQRRPAVALVGGGAVVLVLAALPVDHRVSAAEAAAFRALNGVDVLPFALVWPVMQLGNLMVVPAAALLAAALRRWWLAAGLLVGGAATYLLAKVVKGIVVRGRPDDLLADVVIRGAEAHGRGFVSGHAAVATALVASPGPTGAPRTGAVRRARGGRLPEPSRRRAPPARRRRWGGAGARRRRPGPAAARAADLMLIDSRRALLVSGSLLAGAVVVGLLVVLPATRPVVQEVDDAVWRFAGVVRNEPGTALSVALSWLGGAWVNWPLRAAALVLLAWRRHWLRLAAFALAVLSSEILIGTVKAGVGRRGRPAVSSRPRAPPSRRGTRSPPR